MLDCSGVLGGGGPDGPGTGLEAATAAYVGVGCDWELCRAVSLSMMARRASASLARRVDVLRPQKSER